MLVKIPSPLRSYTSNQSEVQASGDTVEEVLSNLDKQYSGIRFRMIDERNAIRQHIKIYVDHVQIKTIDAEVKGHEVVHIICALSGG